MFDFITVPSAKDTDAGLAEVLRRLRDHYGFDIVKAMHFTQDKNHPYVRIGCKKNRGEDRFEYNYMFNFSGFSRSFLRLMRDEKKAVVYRESEPNDEPKYHVLTKSAKTEVYYPMYDLASDQVIGCIYLGAMDALEFDQSALIEDYRIPLISRMISVLYSDVTKSNHMLSFLKLFDDFLIKNNPHMLRHHYNVAYLANKIAEELDLSFEEKATIYFASLLHDIGEIYINGNLLGKKEKFTEQDIRLERKHVTYGANLVRQLFIGEQEKENLAEIISHHHEQYDGNGYPDGLKGEAIPRGSRIIHVADAVDAMLSSRSYKSAKSLDETIQDLKANKGKQFDPLIVDLMIRILYERSAAKMKIRDIPIIASTLHVVASNTDLLIQGSLINRETFFEFHPNYTSDLEAVNWEAKPELTVYYIANQDIFEYTAVLTKVSEGVIYLSEIESTFSMLSYSLFWEMEALLYLNGETFMQIKATRISGDALSFLAAEEVAEKIELHQPYRIRVYFDNDDYETLPGKVTQQFRTGNDYLFFFAFDELPGTVKQRIIRRIFRKQADLKVSYLIDSN